MRVLAVFAFLAFLSCSCALLLVDLGTSASSTADVQVNSGVASLSASLRAFVQILGTLEYGNLRQTATVVTSLTTLLNTLPQLTGSILSQINLAVDFNAIVGPVLVDLRGCLNGLPVGEVYQPVRGILNQIISDLDSLVTGNVNVFVTLDAVVRAMIRLCVNLNILPDSLLNTVVELVISLVSCIGSILGNVCTTIGVNVGGSVGISTDVQVNAGVASLSTSLRAFVRILSSIEIGNLRQAATIVTSLTSLVNALPQLTGSVLGQINLAVDFNAIVGPVLVDLRGCLNVLPISRVYQLVRCILNEIINDLGSLVTGNVNVFVTLDAVVRAMISLCVNLNIFPGSVLNTVVQLVIRLVSCIGSILSNVCTAIGVNVGGGLNLGNPLQIVTNLLGGVSPVVNNLLGTVTDITGSLTNVIGLNLNVALSSLSGTLNSLVGLVENVVTTVDAITCGLLSDLLTTLVSILRPITSTLQSLIDSILGTVSPLLGVNLRQLGVAVNGLLEDVQRALALVANNDIDGAIRLVLRSTSGLVACVQAIVNGAGDLTPGSDLARVVEAVHQIVGEALTVLRPLLCDMGGETVVDELLTMIHRALLSISISAEASIDFNACGIENVVFAIAGGLSIESANYIRVGAAIAEAGAIGVSRGIRTRVVRVGASVEDLINVSVSAEVDAYLQNVISCFDGASADVSVRANVDVAVEVENALRRIEASASTLVSVRGRTRVVLIVNDAVGVTISISQQTQIRALINACAAAGIDVNIVTTVRGSLAEALGLSMSAPPMYGAPVGPGGALNVRAFARILLQSCSCPRLTPVVTTTTTTTLMPPL